MRFVDKCKNRAPVAAYSRNVFHTTRFRLRFACVWVCCMIKYNVKFLVVLDLFIPLCF